MEATATDADFLNTPRSRSGAFSRIPAPPDALAKTGEYSIFGLTRAATDLRARIDARVDDMFRRGLVAETEQLLKHGLAESKTAMQALGYRQVLEYLRGQRSLPETIELVKIRTRQFARRQMTWFRRQASLTWIQIPPCQDPIALSERMARELSRPPTLAEPYRH